MKLYGTVEVQLLTFIILVLDRMNGVVHMLASLPSAKRCPITLDRRVGGLQTRSTLWKQNKNICLYQESNLNFQIAQFIVLSLC